MIKKIILFLFFVPVVMLSQISPVPDELECDVIIYQEGFEAGLPLGWLDIAVDQTKMSGFNEGWVIDRDTTFTPSTGPIGAQEGSYYAYCDGSGPIARGAQVIMTSTAISLQDAEQPSLLFYLNMHGRAGSFSMNIIFNGSTDVLLAPISADIEGGLHAATEWEEVYVDLSAYAGSQIQLEFVTTKPLSGATGDVAIDDIRICSRMAISTIPTMSQWGVMILFLIILITAIQAMKEQEAMDIGRSY